jgi:hypothetical protein
MTTAVRSVPGHGSLGRAKYHKCPCQACRDAYNAYQRHVRRQKAYGRWQPYTDAEPVRQHLRALMAAGISIARIAAMIGKDTGYISRTLYPRGGQPPKRRISTATANLILAIDPNTKATPQRVDATGTRRRIQALIVMGWPQQRLAVLLGRTGGGTLNELTKAEHVYATTADAVRRLYAALHAADPETHGVPRISAERTRAYSRRKGWYSPLAWDADTIDDPNAQPDTEGIGEDTPGRRDNDRPAEIRHLAGFGLSAETIAKQVGLPVKDVKTRLGKLRTQEAAA